MELTRFSPDAVEFVWPHVEPMLRDIINESEDLTPDEVKEHLARGHAQLWLAHEMDGGFGVLPTMHMAMVTRLVDTSSERVCHCMYLGGSEDRFIRRLKSGLDFIDEIADWAKSEGATCMQAFPRPGLARLLKKKNFQLVKKGERISLYFRDLNDVGVQHSTVDR